MRLSGCDEKIIRLFILQNLPNRFNVIFGISPIPFGVQVAKPKRLLKPQRNTRESHRNFSRHEVQTSTRRFVIKEDAVCGEDAISSAVNLGDVVRAYF